MSEDQDLESIATDESVSESERLSYEELKSELAKVRREAASRRVSAKEKDSELDEFRKWKDAQKSELDRLTERASTAEQELASLRRDRLQREIAEKAGLDLDLADRIRGESEDEMLKDAKELAERAGKRTNVDLDPFATRRGTPVRGASKKEDPANQFRNWFENQVS